MQDKSTKRLKETAKSYLFSFSADHWLAASLLITGLEWILMLAMQPIAAVRYQGCIKPGTADLDQHSSTCCIIGETGLNAKSTGALLDFARQRKSKVSVNYTKEWLVR